MAAVDLNTVRSVIEGRLAIDSANFPADTDYLLTEDGFALLYEDDTFIYTEMAIARVIPVVFHNQPYIPTPASSWVQCLVSFGSSNYLTLGGTTGSSNSVIGVIVINIFTAKGVGPGANYTIGKRIRDLYNRQIISGVHFDPPTGPEVVAAPSPEGFFQTQVRMTFETFEDL